MNNFRSIQEELLGQAMLEMLLWTYAIVGGIFVIYAFAIFIQYYIKFRYRGLLALFFLVIGTLFLNLTARILTGYVYHFTLLTIISIILMAIIGGVFVAVVYSENKFKRRNHRDYKNRRNR